ncbi:hypothetical protein AAVH_26596 [Aphelenchoides avenae]|nr:hypothetical protein AAVH_26596 [Aphelenchus avenae]
MSTKRSMSAAPYSGKRCRSIGPVNVRAQVLPAEMLVIILRFLKRRELDNGAIVCRRFRWAVGSITDIMRMVEKVSFGPHIEMGGYRFAYVRDELLQQRNTRSGRLQSMIELQLTGVDVDELLDLFVNSLRYTIASSEVILKGVTFDAKFASRLESITGKCVISNLRLIDVRMGSDATLLEIFRRLPAFDLGEPQTLQLEGSIPRCTIKRVPINDEMLKWLAASGIWYHGGHVWPSDGVTEEGILDYFFGDYPNDDADKDLMVSTKAGKAGVSRNFVNAFLEARRNCPKTFQFRLKLHGIRLADLDLEAMMPYQLRDWDEGFRPPKSTGVHSIWGGSDSVEIRSCIPKQFSYR